MDGVFMKNLMIYGSLAFFSTVSIAGERTTILNNVPKYSVSHEQADKLLNQLKDDSRKDIMKFRPSTKETRLPATWVTQKPR